MRSTHPTLPFSKSKRGEKEEHDWKKEFPIHFSLRISLRLATYACDKKKKYFKKKYSQFLTSNCFSLGSEMAITSEDVNYLIYRYSPSPSPSLFLSSPSLCISLTLSLPLPLFRYLQESGFIHTAFAFASESSLSKVI